MSVEEVDVSVEVPAEPVDVDVPAVAVVVPAVLVDVPAVLLEVPVFDALMPACVVSLSEPPPPPPQAVTSAPTAKAVADMRTPPKKLIAMWGTANVGMSRSQSSSTETPDDTCCDALSIGRQSGVSECKKQGNATAPPKIAKACR